MSSLDQTLLSAAALRPLLHTRVFGAKIVHFHQIASTQQAAAESAQVGAAEGTLFVAESQSGGRGRHGHSWESPPGEGIYLSLLLYPAWPAAEFLWFTLAAGLAVADAVAEVTALPPEIRWPNDLLLKGKKFCGLLVEAAGDSSRMQYAILGVGINVHQRTFPPDLEPIATSLDLHAAAPVSRVQLCATVVRRVEERYFGFRCGEHEALREEFEARCRYAHGLEVRVGGVDGYWGCTEGLDSSGYLRVRLPDASVRVVISGDVRPA